MCRLAGRYGIDVAGYMWARGVLWSRMAVLSDPDTGERFGVLAKWFDYFNHDKVPFVTVQWRIGIG
jgi:hypothetical protein